MVSIQERQSTFIFLFVMESSGTTLLNMTGSEEMDGWMDAVLVIDDGGDIIIIVTADAAV